ncbi:MAG: AI-2E family transporter [Pirellulaceae bacterium]
MSIVPSQSRLQAAARGAPEHDDYYAEAHGKYRTNLLRRAIPGSQSRALPGRICQLFPIARRQRVVEVMNAIGDSLFSWCFISMAVTGGGTGLVLFFGVPMAMTLGVITGLLTFIPNIGGILALGLSMLMALPQGPMTVLGGDRLLDLAAL